MKSLYCNGKYYLWKEGDLHTKDGFLKEADIKNKTSAESNIEKKFYIFEPSFNDLLKKIHRGPQIPLQKDILQLLNYINKDSIVLEAGTGCGCVALNLARFVKKVITYERNKEYIKITKKNFNLFNINNIEVINKDIFEGIEEKNIDMIFFDLEEPYKLLNEANKSLKQGGYLIIYLPNIPQIQDVIRENNNFIHEKTIEILEREWLIDKKRARPKTEMIGHTGFLNIFRKI